MTIATGANKSGGEALTASQPPRWVLLTLLCVALLVRARVLQSLGGGFLTQDPDGYARVAVLIVNDGAYASVTYNADPVLTAARPPLYPMFLAGLRLVGDMVMGAALVGIAHVALGVGTVIAVWRLARSWSLAPWISILAAALVAIDPIQLHYSAQFMTETLAAFLATVALSGADAIWPGRVSQDRIGRRRMGRLVYLMPA